MRKLLPALLATLTLLGCAATPPAPAPAAPIAVAPQPAPDRVLQPMLWQVSGHGLATPSYLFGTIHLSDPRITRMHPLSRAAFKKSASLHTEISLDPAASVGMVTQLIRRDSQSLNAHIGPELAARLDEELKHIEPSLNAAAFQFLKTWAVAVALPSLGDQLSGGRALDMQLWEKAAKAGKRCAALETVDGHLKGLNELSPQEQILLLKTSLDGMANERSGERPHLRMDNLVNLYLRGDRQGIHAVMQAWQTEPGITPEETALAKKMNGFLLVDRNVVMAQAIHKELQAHPQETHFFAAGTAHFVGDDSVVALLEKAGYQVAWVKAGAKKK